MCFYLCLAEWHKPARNIFKWKVARKPIKVYKAIRPNGINMYTGKYRYHRGYNFPEEKAITIDKEFFPDLFCSFTIVSSGVLHSYKEKVKMCRPLKVYTMYIPKGYKYINNGCLYSEKEVISMCLYWPKNIFDRILWWFKSL